ncbi:MAG: peptidoglycan DD-metalloendopeptidase family protein [Pseudomonadota bacterium]
MTGCGSSKYAAPVSERAEKARVASDSKRLLPPVPTGFYRVQPGDTLFKIAFDKGLDFNALVTWNGLADPNRILAGMLLRLTPPPLANGRQGGVESAKSAVTAASGPGTQTPVTMSTASSLEVPPDRWHWPMSGPLLARFGEGTSKGLDIAGEKGQMVRAAATGKVVYVGAGLRGYGKLIIIRHGKSLLSAYAHHARILVQEGQEVARGQVIGEVGDTDTDRLKLHFEIRDSGVPVDPLGLLPPMS